MDGDEAFTRLIAIKKVHRPGKVLDFEWASRGGLGSFRKSPEKHVLSFKHLVLYTQFLVTWNEKIMAEKRDKFVILAEKRVNRAIKDLRLIGNLSNKNNYSYSDSDIQKILVVLDQEVKNLKAKFLSDDGKAIPVFKL